MMGGLVLIGCGVAVLVAAILTDTLVAWAIRKWRASAWGARR